MLSHTHQTQTHTHTPKAYTHIKHAHIHGRIPYLRHIFRRKLINRRAWERSPILQSIRINACTSLSTGQPLAIIRTYMLCSALCSAFFIWAPKYRACVRHASLEVISSTNNLLEVDPYPQIYLYTTVKITWFSFHLSIDFSINLFIKPFIHSLIYYQ